MRYRRRAGSGRSRSDSGAAAVEFAIVVPLLLLVLFGIIQYAFFFLATQSASAAARDAARKSAVGDCSDSELTDYVAAKLTSVNVSDLVVDREYVAGRVIGNTVRVEVQFKTYDFNFPFVPVPNDALIKRSFDTRLEDVGAGSCT